MRNDQNVKFVGMDMHKDSISLAIAENGSPGEVRLYGIIKNTTDALEKVISSRKTPGNE